MSSKTKLLFSNFSLRIIALLSVLSDHIALFFIPEATLIYTLMRVFGRLAFPLFGFFIVEGVIHSKNHNKYLLRLFYLYIVIQVFIIALFNYDASYKVNNVFATLGASAAFLVYIEKKEWKKFYLLIPIIVVSIFNLINDHTKFSGFHLFAGDYSMYGILLIITYYFSRKIVDVLVTNYPATNSDEPTRNQTLYNSGAVIALVVISLVYYVLSVYSLTKIDANFQSFTLLLIPLLLFYNGKLGYTSKGWRTFYYLFFPVHIILLAVISLFM